MNEKIEQKKCLMIDEQVIENTDNIKIIKDNGWVNVDARELVKQVDDNVIDISDNNNDININHTTITELVDRVDEMEVYTHDIMKLSINSPINFDFNCHWVKFNEIYNYSNTLSYKDGKLYSTIDQEIGFKFVISVYMKIDNQKFSLTIKENGKKLKTITLPGSVTEQEYEWMGDIIVKANSTYEFGIGGLHNGDNGTLTYAFATVLKDTVDRRYVDKLISKLKDYTDGEKLISLPYITHKQEAPGTTLLRIDEPKWIIETGDKNKYVYVRDNQAIISHNSANWKSCHLTFNYKGGTGILNFNDNEKYYIHNNGETLITQVKIPLSIHVIYKIFDSKSITLTYKTDQNWAVEISDMRLEFIGDKIW